MLNNLIIGVSIMMLSTIENYSKLMEFKSFGIIYTYWEKTYLKLYL